MDEKILQALLEKQTQILEKMSEKENKTRGMHTKTPAQWSNFTPLHGGGGIWQGPGLERDVITAHIRPEGFASMLPLLPTVDQNPQFATLTGYTPTVGTQPDHACDDAPYGYVKNCLLTARFGRIRYDTNTIDIDDVMLRINRGDFTDLVLHGRVLGLTGLEPTGLNESQILNVVTMSEMVTVGVAFERELTRQTWQGSRAIPNEFAGLDAQIATGQVDANTGVACPALDSDVKNYGYNLLSNTIVNHLGTLEWYLTNNARKMGLNPVQWVIVMRPELWFELTAMWPCAYNTTKCSPQVDTNSTVFIDGRDNTSERDAMRNGMYLDINGRRYPVVVDDGIFEHNNANNANCNPGEYASTIYMVPLTIVGNLPVTYFEHVDYRRAAADVALLRNMQPFFWSDSGVYSWAFEAVKWCYKLSAKTERRVILRTPHLAGRIDAVKYAPLQHLRDYNTDSPYHVDGGVSLRDPLGSFHSVWGSR